MKILIIHTAFIGDIVLATTLVAKIKDTYPNSDIYFLTTPSGKNILENNPKIKNIICYDKRAKDRGIYSFFSLASRLRKEKFDICLCPHRYLRSTMLSFLSFSKLKLGYDIASFSFLYNEKIKYDKNKHEVEKLLSFVNNNNNRYEIELYPNKENILKIKKLVGETKKRL